MINFLTETIVAIANSGHTINDIKFIGAPHTGHSCSWDEFEKLANFEYDNSFGAQLVAYDLTIIFKDDTFLHRSEYDGSEWWDFVTPLKISTEVKKITNLLSTFGNETLEEINI